MDITLHDKEFKIVFQKLLWHPGELLLAKCYNFTINEEKGQATCYVHLTAKRALYHFIKLGFKSFSEAATEEARRNDFYERVEILYKTLADNVDTLIKSRLPYADKLFNHQREVLQESYYKQFNFYAMEMGTGKTLTSASLSRIHGFKRTVIICPASVKYNWYRDLVKFGYNELFFTVYDSTKRRSFKALNERFVIINYDILSRFLNEISLDNIDHFILDECFHYDSIIDTIDGPMKIGDIVSKNIDTMVLSYNYLKKTTEYRKILRKFENPISDKTFVKITYAEGEIICTGAHKIWTSEGFQRADAIREGSIIHRVGVCEVRKNFLLRSERHKKEGFLRGFLRRKNKNGVAGKKGTFKESCIKILGWQSERDKEPGHSPSNEVKQPNDEFRGKRKDEAEVNRQEVQGKRREREINNSADTTSIYSKNTGRIPNKNSRCQAFIFRLTKFLQSGFGYSGKENSNRSGWKKSQVVIKKGSGQKERRCIEGVRVEGVEVLERGGNHEYGYLYSKDTVYDIEVEENHNYFANGILVSNCHTLKNHLTGRTEKTIELVSKFPQAKITMLSGTPIKNRVNDVFSYLKIIGHELGKSQKKFLEQYTIQSTGRGGDRVTGGKNLQDLHVKLANFMIRKTKEECLDLPDKVYLSYRYEMDDYRDEYNKIIKEMSEVKEISSLTGSLHSLNIITAKAKERGIIELAETIIESGKKVIIFSSYTEPLEDLRKHFGTSCVMVTGAVSSYNRDALVQRFINEETCTVFLANMIAGGVGINLVNASDVIFMNFPFTPSELHQAVDRAHRIGQTQSVNIHYTFCDDSIDEYIYDIVISKEIDANAVIDQGKEVIQRENTTEILIKAILKKDDVVFKKPTHKKKEELEPISGQGAGDDSGSQELHSGDRPAEPVPPTEVLRVPEGEPAAQEVVFTPPSFL